MSEFKKWKITKIDEPNPDNGNTGYHEVGLDSYGSSTIAEIWFGEFHKIQTKQEALKIAKLISKAPELLDMLEQICDLPDQDVSALVPDIKKLIHDATTI